MLAPKLKASPMWRAPSGSRGKLATAGPDSAGNRAHELSQVAAGAAPAEPPTYFHFPSARGGAFFTYLLNQVIIS